MQATSERPIEAAPIDDDIRATGIGASEGAAVLEVSPYRTPTDVYLDKINGRIDDETDYTIFGRCVEPAIVRFYERLNGVDLTYPLPIQRHARHRHILATPDAQRSPTHGVEVKSMDWRIARAIDESSLDEVKPDYVVQCNQQMLVMGWEVVTLVALVDRSLKTWEIPRNESLINLIVEVEGEFWDRVQRRDPPPVDTRHPRALESLKRLHSRILPGKIVTLSEAAGRAFEEYERLGKIENEAKERRKELRAVYLSEIGENYAGLLPAGDRMIRRAMVEGKQISYFRDPYVDARAVKYKGEPVVSMTVEDAIEVVEESEQEVDRLQVAERRLIAAGFRLRHLSDHGSRYYVHAMESIQIRISDHDPNPATAAWIKRNNVYGLRHDQPDLLEAVGAIITEANSEVLTDAD